jgi:hypothetical protein
MIKSSYVSNQESIVAKAVRAAFPNPYETGKRYAVSLVIGGDKKMLTVYKTQRGRHIVDQVVVRARYDFIRRFEIDTKGRFKWLDSWRDASGDSPFGIVGLDSSEYNAVKEDILSAFQQAQEISTMPAEPC